MYGNHTLIFRNGLKALVKNEILLVSAVNLDDDDEDENDDAFSADPLRKSGFVHPQRTPTNIMDKNSK